jgi:hypothetical protein
MASSGRCHPAWNDSKLSMIIRRQKDVYSVQLSALEINDLFGSVKSKLSAMDSIISEVPRNNYERFIEERKRIVSLRDELFDGIHHQDLIIK